MLGNELVTNQKVTLITLEDQRFPRISAKHLANQTNQSKIRHMTTHQTKIVTIGNGGTKARRWTCSCGQLGCRFAFGPAVGRTAAEATAKAEAEALAHSEG